MGTAVEHWLSVLRRKEAIYAEQKRNALIPKSQDVTHSRPLTKDFLAEIWGCKSLDMCEPETKTSHYNFKSGAANRKEEDSFDTALNTSEEHEASTLQQNSLLVPGPQSEPPTIEDFSRLWEEMQKESIDIAPITLRTPQSFTHVEEQTLALYQDLTSLFEYHLARCVSVTYENQAADILHAEMDVLVARYEDGLPRFIFDSLPQFDDDSSAESSCNSTTKSGSGSIPINLYSGMSERIKIGLIYRDYVKFDQEQFPSRPRASNPWSYLGPKRYMAKPLSRQRISSDMFMMCQNKQALMKELRAVLKGRRVYLKKCSVLSDDEAKIWWRFNPTFTHRDSVPSYALVGNLQRLYLQMGDKRLLGGF